MGRKEKSQEVNAEPDLRRSTRKRKLKKESDLDFDYDYNDTEEKYPMIEGPRIQKAPRDTISPTSSENIATFSPIFNFNWDEPSYSPSKKSDLNIDSMDPKEIINAHCKLLEARLQRVASGYVATWPVQDQELAVTENLDQFAMPAAEQDAEIVEENLEELVEQIEPTQN